MIKSFLNLHLSLSAARLFQTILAKLYWFLHLVLCLPCLLLASMGCHSVVLIIHLYLFDVSNPQPLFSYDNYYSLLLWPSPCPWCSFLISPYYAKHFSLISVRAFLSFRSRTFVRFQVSDRYVSIINIIPTDYKHLLLRIMGDYFSNYYVEYEKRFITL